MKITITTIKDDIYMTNNSEINRYYSRPLDVHRWSDHPEAKKIVHTIWSEYYSDSYPESGQGNKASSSRRKQFKVLLLDLYVAWLEDPQLSIGVGMSKSAYKAKSRYNALYISYLIVEMVRHGHHQGLIDLKKGSEDSKTTTRIRATAKLQEYFKHANLDLLDFTRHSGQETIILKIKDEGDDKAHPIAYMDSDFADIPQMRQEMNQYNALLHMTFIDIPTLKEPLICKESSADEPVSITHDKKFVRRIFYRGNWKLGGRFHGGWWQNIGEDWRKQIYINNESTIEQDYSGLHVNLLYGLQGLQPLKDPYSLDLDYGLSAVEQRTVVKGLVLISINASSAKSAFNAFRLDQPRGSKAKHFTNDFLDRLLTAFKKKHPRIESSLCSDKGVELMNIDGRITAKVINHFTAKNIPVLTIHDSYITQNKYTGELKEVMNKATLEELNGYKINIDQDGIGLDQIQAFRNLDRTNANDFSYDLIPSYEHTEEYKKRMNRHKQWLKEVHKA